MEENKRSEILQAVETWAKNHPEPDKSIISLGGFGTFTANDIVEEMKDRTAAGKLLFRLIEHSAEVHGYEFILNSFVQADPTRQNARL